MADYALELSFDADGDAAVRACWQALAAAGLPSQADNSRGMENAPHLSLAVAREIPLAVKERAAEHLSTLLPTPLNVHGTVLFGAGSKVTLALVAEPNVEVAQRVYDLRAKIPALRHPVWTPHITLARRLSRGDVPAALAAVDVVRPRKVRANRMRWWDPLAGEITELTAPQDKKR